MTNEEKIQEYRKMSKDELRKISHDYTRSEEDIIIASIELGKKEKADAEYYTTKQVLERVYGRDYMVKGC